MTTLALLDSARRMGHLVWYSRQAFSLFGAWARDDRSPQLSRRFGTLSNTWSEHTAACFGRLPTIALTSGETLTPEQFVASPDPADEQLVSELLDETEPSDRPAATQRLLRRTAALVDDHRALIDPVLDEPTATVLDDLARSLATNVDMADASAD